MPIYEYQCTKCREVCEVLQKAKDKPLDKCPHCGGPMVKRISSPAIQFKGSGFYITDYARKNGSGDTPVKPSTPAAGSNSSESAASSNSGGSSATPSTSTSSSSNSTAKPD